MEKESFAYLRTNNGLILCFIFSEGTPISVNQVPVCLNLNQYCVKPLKYICVCVCVRACVRACTGMLSAHSCELLHSSHFKYLQAAKIPATLMSELLTLQKKS